MEKVYIQVHELLTAYNASISEIMERVKTGTLALYEGRAFDYVKIDSFDAYIDKYISSERDKIEKRYIYEAINLQTPNALVLRAREISDNIREKWQYFKRVRQLGAREIAEERRNRLVKYLDDREQVARYIISHLFVKYNEYENVIKDFDKIINIGRKQKRDDRIKETREACDNVKKLLLSKKEHENPLGKDILKKYVYIELNSKKQNDELKKVHIETFNAWYSEMVKLGYARKQGNPRKTRKPA